ncbi:MAG: DUF167 domain-containing protein [Pseudomonadota bacterium]
MMTLAVHVQPRASRNAVVGWHGDALKVALTAPPVEGAANAALIAFIAEHFGLKRSQISLVRGDSSRQKLLALDADPAWILTRLPAR